MKPQLLKIKSHLEKLLADAKLRTPGRWTNDILVKATTKDPTGGHCVSPGIVRFEPWDINPESNARFIASCAGNAEAGWRRSLREIERTLAFIDFPTGQDATDTQCSFAALATDMAHEIVAEWEGLV